MYNFSAHSTLQNFLQSGYTFSHESMQLLSKDAPSENRQTKLISRSQVANLRIGKATSLFAQCESHGTFMSRNRIKYKNLLFTSGFGVQL